MEIYTNDKDIYTRPEDQEQQYFQQWNLYFGETL